MIKTHDQLSLCLYLEFPSYGIKTLSSILSMMRIPKTEEIWGLTPASGKFWAKATNLETAQLLLSSPSLRLKDEDSLYDFVRSSSKK